MTVVAAADHAPHKSVMSDPLICTRGAWSLPLGSTESIIHQSGAAVILDRDLANSIRTSVFLCLLQKFQNLHVSRVREPKAPRGEVRTTLNDNGC